MNHYTDKLIPCKLQFFSFIASNFGLYLQVFQTDSPMLLFMNIPNNKDFKKLDKKWLNDKQNLLDTHQMDIAAATQDLQITSGKKHTFYADCRVVVVNIILKLYS